jgi:tetratricopeptide (TPR) repeat protein
MTRASAVTAVLALVLPLLSLRAADGKPQVAREPQAAPETKDTATQDKSPSSSPEQLKGILRDALKLIHSIGDRASKTDGDTPGVTVRSGPDEELQAEVVKVIGRAQAKLGDLAGARSSWQAALDSIQEIASYQGQADRAGLYLEIAEAQNEAGDHDEARFTLRQALQSARSIKSESSFFSPAATPDAEFSTNPLTKKTDLLHRIAQLQGQAGESAASEQTFRLAVETADSIQNELNKVYVLLEIAKGGPPEKVKPIWTKVLDFALAIKDEYPRAKAVEMVLRARIKALMVDEALAAVVDRLKGDLQNYALWVVADAVASSEEKFAPKAMARLSQLAMKAEFDRPSKKINVFRRIAEAQARLGDYDGAYRTAGEPHPVNDVQTFRATQARMNVMKAVAESQLKAKQRDAARDTVSAALELIGALPDEDAESYFPLEELGSIQARSGDPAGAEGTAMALNSIHWRVYILAQVAEAHAEAGRRDLARKAIRRASDDARRAPNASLWSGIDLAQGGHSSEYTQNLEPMLPVLQIIASAQAKIGDLDGAKKTIKDMGDSDTAKWTRNATIAEIAEAQLKAGHTEDAMRAVELIAESDSYASTKNNLLEQIARRQAATGDPAAVLEWVGKQKLPDAKLQALRGLADGLVERIAPKKPKPVDSGPLTKRTK